MKTTVQQILALITDQKWINRNTVTGTLPPRDKIVALLASMGVLAQTTDQVVTEADWRDENFEREFGLDCLYVWAYCDEEYEEADTAVVFDYANNQLSCC